MMSALLAASSAKARRRAAVQALLEELGSTARLSLQMRTMISRNSSKSSSALVSRPRDAPLRRRPRHALPFAARPPVATSPPPPGGPASAPRAICRCRSRILPSTVSADAGSSSAPGEVARRVRVARAPARCCGSGGLGVHCPGCDDWRRRARLDGLRVAPRLAAARCVERRRHEFMRLSAVRAAALNNSETFEVIGTAQRRAAV